ncbi:MAG: chromosomal replication initiator protein DnaA [Phycisphaerae bacterium]|nr:chromosomal replication initiator protein DnaA [Phycisphaerae bacterium]
MLSTVMDDVCAFSDALAKKIGRQKYNIWFKNSTKIALDGDYFTIGVPNHFMARWIEEHFSSHINDALRETLGPDKKITFKVDSGLSSRQKKSTLSTDRVEERNNDKYSFSRPKKTKVQQRSLKLSLDTFVVGRSNELAYNAAKAVACEKNCPFNPLFIHGGYGVGKTHLMQGICNSVSRNRPEVNWLYLSAEDFANQFILALKTRKLDAFRHRLRQTDLLAIDDIHFLSNKPSTQQEFLHTFNSIDLAGKQVVLVSDAHPKMIEKLSEKLINRFVSGMVVKVDSPDFKTRQKICRQFALANKYSIPENVINYVAENITANVRELEGAIIKLVAFSSLQNHKITLSLAKEILAEHLIRTDPIVHSSDIESAVCRYFEATITDLHSSKKNKTVSLARHFSMYIARKHTNMSSPEVGRFMGGKNHATVLLACKKIEEAIKTNKSFNWISPEGNRTEKARSILKQLETNIAE